MSKHCLLFKHIVWLRREPICDAWRSRACIRVVDEEFWAQTIAVAIIGEFISEEPSMNAYRTDQAMLAREGLGMSMAELDLTGDMWEPVEVMLCPGGE